MQQRWSCQRMGRALLVGAMAGLLPLMAGAASPWPWKSVEERAQHDARIFNEMSPQFVDGPTVASKAVVQGRQVVYVHTMRLDATFTPELVDRFIAEMHAIALGLNCSGARDKDPDFQAGLSFLTIHQNEHGQRLAVQRIDKAICDRL